MQMTCKLVLRMIVFASLLGGCDSVSYVKSELTGTVKPEGGIQERLPPTRDYAAPTQALWRAVREVLDAQGYVYDENPSAGTIRTEPRQVGDVNKMQIATAIFSAKLFIKVENSQVTFRARFDKRSNVMLPEENVEYAEKENELRRDFFSAVDKRLQSIGATAAPRATPASAGKTTMTDGQAPEKPRNESEQGRSNTTMSVLELQQRLAELGYDPGPRDGVMGRKTVDALKKFQRKSNLATSGDLDSDTVQRLRSKP